MLKQRVLTALVLLPLVMAAIFALPPQSFMGIVAFILLGGAWEYSRLAGLKNRTAVHSMVYIQAALFAVLFYLRDQWQNVEVMALGVFCLAWLLMFVRLYTFHAETEVNQRYRLVSYITAIVSITTGWLSIGWIAMQAQGPWLILLLLLIVWAADTGAYFAGMNFGKNKLAPLISPNKTREGLLGGLITTTLVAILASRLMPVPAMELSWLIPLCLVTALASAAGDLLISMHKRISGYKDSGNVLPGHGGILDRLDSLIAAAPFFAFGLALSGY